ncbi:MAG: GrpB family protein [Mesorhizobium sp.]|uniref:GrpB family protein n=1 Tax=Mesorhizobium sp. TaxID=1871066 RepID=UPI000FE5971E|nr:GrpB family protein [Mesorhizobium sp.]RWM90172.1 MAG: GrpB family protein [Mesorhizobium sp.]
MALTSKITAYNVAWPDMFVAERKRIAKAFGSELISIHHVGSTAVPGLAAKPEIDILVEVSEHRDVFEVDAFMRSCGYIRGKDLSPGHHFYRRDVNGVRTHKVHVCISGQEQIYRMLVFRDLLRRDDELRRRYQELKLRLEAENRKGISEYLAKKAPFIDAVVEAKP